MPFQQQHGHTRVPVKRPEDPKLGRWVSRIWQEKERLYPERILLLEAISFVWGYRCALSQHTANYLIASHISFSTTNQLASDGDWVLLAAGPEAHTTYLFTEEKPLVMVEEGCRKPPFL